MMKKKILFIGLFWTIFALGGCRSSARVVPIASPAPTPTRHPLLNNLSTDQDVIPTTTANTTPAPVESGIHSVEAILNGDSATITWSDSNLTIGSIAYGKTEQYELGETGNDGPSLNHAITLTGLEAETTYYYRITTVNPETGNAINIFRYSFDTIRQVPLINVWYGVQQTFGKTGTPQRWINVLGNVSDIDGVRTLAYALNGEAEKLLSIGPDSYRLAEPGDFNVDIARAALLSGENELVLKATDGFNNQEVVTITINYTDDNFWVESYTVDWQIGTDIQDMVEVVDGLWKINAGEIHTEIPGYNRSVAIGDIVWTDYEVTVPITVHDVYFVEGDNNAPGLGFLARWTGHTDIPVANRQPKSGWRPFGAIAWYRWDTPDLVFLRMEGTTNDTIVENVVAEPQRDTRYNYKLRVETVDSGETLYRFKVWLDDQPEPEAWDLRNEIAGPPNGSLLLLAHHVDASFGEVTITALASPTSTPALPNISGGNYYTITSPITETLSITETSPITGTLPVTATVPVTSTSSIPAFTIEDGLEYIHAFTEKACYGQKFNVSVSRNPFTIARNRLYIVAIQNPQFS